MYLFCVAEMENVGKKNKKPLVKKLKKTVQVQPNEGNLYNFKHLYCAAFVCF